MKSKKSKVYIDAANLHSAIYFSDWDLSYRKLFRWLSEEFGTEDIYLFIGYIADNDKLYGFLKSIGYKLIFKETLKLRGEIKGNCDAELVLKSVVDILKSDFKNLVLVSSDGDFACLLKFALQNKKNVRVVSPSRKLSYLIRKLNIPITYLSDLKNLIQKEKAPGRD